MDLPIERHRAVGLAVPLGILVGTGLAVVFALSADYDSTTEARLRSLHRTLLVLAVPVVVFVEGLLVYAVVRFTGTDEAVPHEGGQRLELAWTVATCLLVLVVGLLALPVMAQPAVIDDASPGPPGDTSEVTVTAAQYTWRFSYDGTGVHTRDHLVLPANRTVRLRLTAEDVIHSVSVPGLGIKRDALPGQYTTVHTTPTAPGTYRLYCAEFCGAGHAGMTAEVEVLSPAAYDAWLRERPSPNASRQSQDASRPLPNASRRLGGA